MLEAGKEVLQDEVDRYDGRLPSYADWNRLVLAMFSAMLEYAPGTMTPRADHKSGLHD